MIRYPSPPRGSRLLDYLRLMRISNIFTAAADVAMGFLLVHATLQPLGVFALLVAASGLLYTAGMVLNDVFDVETDRRERPERPIPAGRISLATARCLGWALLIAGLLCGWSAGYLPQAAGVAWRSGAVATALAVCVVLYDAWLKRTPLGPIAMGACRLLNVLLGISVAAPFDGWNLIGFGPHHLTIASGIGVYIAGVTWLARTEARQSNRWQLASAAAVMMGGVALLGLAYRLLQNFEPMRLSLTEPVWWLLLGMLAVTILRRCGTAIAQPTPRQVQWAVRHALWSLIMLDAAVVLLVRDFYALGMVALLIPTLIMGKWVAAT
jgi:4-hydroxybenzoate polyprenyltransferase